MGPIMRKLRFVPILLGLVIVAGSALAEEVIFFTNGTSMPIRAHSVKDGMIRVDLGADASMAFPASVVDRIEVAGVHVSLDTGPANRVGSGNGPTPGRPQREKPRINPANLLGSKITPPAADVATGKDGVTYHRPLARSANPRKREFRVSGSSTARNARMGRGGIQTNRGMGGRRSGSPTQPESEFPRPAQATPHC